MIQDHHPERILEDTPMQNEEFTVQNVKCQGCVSAIHEGLTMLPGIQDAQVEIETGHVSVTGENLNRTQISEKLAELGYPET